MLTKQPGRSIRAFRLALPLTVAVAVAPIALVAATRDEESAVQTSRLPERLSDAEFWKLLTDISEPGGYFRIVDNFTSNEREVGQIYTMLREKRGWPAARAAMAATEAAEKSTAE